MLALLLPGCGFLVEPPGSKPPACVSTCGAELWGSEDCEGFQGAEDRMLGAFGPVFGPGVCASLKNWRVTARHEPSGSWSDDWGRTVGGLSGCDQVAYLSGPAQNGWAVVLDDWHQLSFFHEAAHHQECPAENTGHTGWNDQIYPAIYRAATTESGALPVLRR